MLDPKVLATALILVTSLVVTLLVIRRGVPFWLFHLWMNLPIVGAVARDARMTPPTKEKADWRTDRIFRRYYNRIADCLPGEGFERARAYLFIAGDADTKPIGLFEVLLLILFLTADAASFAYLLGARFNAEASENEVVVFAVGIVFLFVALLSVFGHVVGGILRRTRALREIEADALDPKRDVPAGEKSTAELISRVHLDEDQDRDRPLKEANDSQRTLNRIAHNRNDRGGYKGSILYLIFVLALAAAQFWLREVSQIAATTLNLNLNLNLNVDLPAALTGAGTADSGVLIANITFVAIFLATQVYAVRTGYTHRFVGIESRRAYQRLKGADTFEDVKAAYDARVRAADVTLSNLLTRYKRYRDLDPDRALFLERIAREKAAAKARDAGGDGDPSAPEAEPVSNVTPFPVGEGSGK